MILLVMGVAGAGKTTVGRRLAARLGWAFHDADDWHGAEARARMARGEPLTDLERDPWIARLAGLVRETASAGESAVLACSALRAAHRARLAEAASAGGGALRVVYLRLDPAQAAERVGRRRGHFAPADLVPSQFAALEAPTDALVLDATLPAERLVETVVQAVGRDG